MKIGAALFAFILSVTAIPLACANFASFQATTSVVPPACSSGVLDTFAASPGAWTAAYSHRKLKAAYAGSAIQLQRSSDSATLDVGFTTCDPNPTPTLSFCSTQTLAAGTTASARVAYPTGSVIHVYNQGPSPVFWASGSGSVSATTAGNRLTFKTGVNITVGADTNIAAIIGSGYGVDGGAGSATLFLTNCGLSKVYDQSGNGFDMTPITAGAVNQMGYIPTGQGSLPLAFGCLASCGLKAADSATYKTATIQTFTVLTWGEDITTNNFVYTGIGYPTTTASSGQDFRWGLVASAFNGVLVSNINGSTLNGAEGFGGVWQGQNLTQYDYATSGSNRWNGGTQFFSTVSGTPTYPNAVGLYLMGDAAGNGTPGTWAEALVASGTQTARDSISANQVSYWGITTGTAATAALTNPLSDGFNWNQVQIGAFAPNPPGTASPVSVNGNSYFPESSWNNYTQWQCSNCISTGGRLGDMWRFQVTSFDTWDGTNRSELDGSTSAQFNNGTTFWISYAVWVEPGTSYTASWNITGQMHNSGGPICCIFNINLLNDQFVVNTDNATSGVQTTRYTSPTITRGQWYHFVFKVLASAAGTTDTFDVWFDPVTPGTMSHVAALTSGSYFGGNTSSTFAYWKYGNYRETGASLPSFAIRYGNMQACAQGADCTAKYGVSDLSANAATPLANPSH